MSGVAKTLAPIAGLIPGWGPIAAAGLGLVGGMGGGASGSGQDASTVGGYYQNALNQVPGITDEAINTEKAALGHQFDLQDDQMKARLAAMGITNSGAGKNDFSNLGADQASSLAAAISPLYQQRLGIQGSILGAMPGAQSGAYQQGNQDYYNAMQGYGGLLGSLARSGNTPGQPNYNPYNDIPSAAFVPPDTIPAPYVPSGVGINP